jgi:hypothetical protein
VWDHKPTADELLDARLADGWTPTPTSTVHGDRIEGFAASRFPDLARPG